MNPKLPKRPATPASSGRSGGTWLGLFFLLFVAAGFIGLIGMILPQVRGLLLVVGGMVGFFGIHYITWGRWLSSIVERDENDPL